MPNGPFYWSALLSSQEWIYNHMTRLLYASHLEVLFPDGTLIVLGGTSHQASQVHDFWTPAILSSTTGQ